MHRELPLRVLATSVFCSPPAGANCYLTLRLYLPSNSFPPSQILFFQLTFFSSNKHNNSTNYNKFLHQLKARHSL
ncbi:hypothetical protein M501DRAFT_1001191 [Patellaria atrata CBS 101060]|uniref:Uncharacterized protein n=1 Tax=Patellaria atrata CBS 101060 TaxID=1346257 RepID=A0A9P4S3D1_9PEZI|nr:hypothetical protein M501DRAFT_1001191 [Patellaria atrata CBS 101060]